MPEYLSPGVYVEEIDAGPQPIAAVATSTAGVVGVTRRGPASPLLVTSYGDFLRQYGGPLDVPDEATRGAWSDDGQWWQTAESVKAFFDEGGARVYFQRVSPGGAVASSRGFNGGLLALVQTDVTPTSTTIGLSHVVGVTGGTNLDVLSSDGSVIGTVAVQSVDYATRTLRLANPAGLSARRGQDLVGIRAVDTTKNTLTVQAASVGAWGDALSVRLLPTVGARLTLGATPTSGAPVGTTTTADAAAGATAVTVAPVVGSLEATTPAGFSVKVGRNAPVVVSTLAAAGANVTLTLAQALPAAVPSGTAVAKLRPALNAAVLSVTGAARLYAGAPVQLEGSAGTEVLSVVSVGDGTVTLSATPANAYVEGEALTLLEGDLTVRYRPVGGDEVLERLSGLRLTDDGHPDSLVRKVGARSKLVRARTGADFDGTDLTAFPAVGSGAWAALGGGDDALASLSVADFVGEDLGPGQRTGIQALEDIDEVAICYVPGMWSVDVRSALIVHCETLADRFAILDPPPGLGHPGRPGVPESDRHQVRRALLPVGHDHRPAARRRGDTGAAVRLPGRRLRPHGRGPGRPQGARQRGHPLHPGLRGRRCTKREQDMLNPQNINVLRAFPGRGNRVWGARVLTSLSSWKYVSVRRLFLMIEESIDEGTQWVVFEPNDEPLWARVRPVGDPLPHHPVADRRAAGHHRRRGVLRPAATARR